MCDCQAKKGPGGHPGPSIGGGGGNRTRVRRRSAPGATCLAHRLVLVRRQHGVRSAPLDQPLGFSPGRKAPASGDPVMMTLHPRAQAQAGSGLGLKRPERRRRRSRLGFCHRINEEDDALGMLQATSRPPSNPGRPRGRSDGGVRGGGNQAAGGEGCGARASRAGGCRGGGVGRRPCRTRHWVPAFAGTTGSVG